MIFSRLSTLLRAMHTYYDAHAEGGLTYAQARVLATALSCPGATQVELADETRIEPPTMKRHLDALERAGLIRRSPVDGDRRKRAVMATPAGEALDLPRLRDRLEAVAVRGIDPGDLAITATVLQRMEENLRQEPDR